MERIWRRLSETCGYRRNSGYYRWFRCMADYEISFILSMESNRSGIYHWISGWNRLFCQKWSCQIWCKSGLWSWNKRIFWTRICKCRLHFSHKLILWWHWWNFLQWFRSDQSCWGYVWCRSDRIFPCAWHRRNG